MSKQALIPQAFWFRFASTCPRIDNIPKTRESGRLLDLPEKCALADIGQLDGKERWAEVRVAWNPGGLAIAVLATGVSPVQLSGARPEGFANAQFWIDTRDTRTVNRATRFCSRYVARLEAKRSERKLIVKASQQPVVRATADSPRCDPQLIVTRAELSKNAWTLEIFLPAKAVNGFDPETNRRLGFAYQISEFVREDQLLSVGRDFPVGENPSLWSTLELVG
jgi:hypothetical protein